jgi:hypothetical protein
MTRAFVFDHAPYRDAIDRAIAATLNPPTAIDREAETWHREGSRHWWGEHTDPGGDPIQLEQDAAGTFVRFAGRRVPALVDGGTVALGIPDRLGFCVAGAVETCERLLRERPEVAPTLAIIFARAYGASQQSFVEYADAAGWHVLDWTLSDEPFNREAYYRALHAGIGTRLPIHSRAALAALRKVLQAGKWDGSRSDLLTHLSSAA